MIVVDTSALMAVVLGEQEAEACIGVLAAEPEVIISAGTMAEALIVAGHRGVGDEMAALFETFRLDVVTLTPLQPAGPRRPIGDGEEECILPA